MEVLKQMHYYVLPAEMLVMKTELFLLTGIYLFVESA